MKKKLIRSRKKKTGLPPGTPVHVGEPRVGSARVTVVEYSEEAYSEKEYGPGKTCALPGKDSGVTWINVDGVHDVELLQGLAGCYAIHPLVIEDIANTDQRPKREDYGDYLYVVMKMLWYREGEKSVAMEQLSLVLGRRFVLSFQEGIEGDVLGTIRERIRSGRGLIRRAQADFLAYSIIDAVVDNYFLILERIADRIEDLEEELVARPGKGVLDEIHALKREMLFLRKAVWPLREMIGGLERRESPLVNQETVYYLRDLYDHTVQVIDMIETFRDILAGMLDIYLSGVANRTNEVMKVLTVIATIFMPVTFIASIYGMNFRYMPELEQPWGYPAVLLLMLLVVASMVTWFRRKGWF